MTNEQIIAMSIGQIPAAALLLDHAYPGWEHQVNLRTLSLEHSHCCVLGQLYGCFSRGVQELGAAHGVNAFDYIPQPFAQALCAFGGYDYLTEPWRREIQMRRASGLQVPTPPVPQRMPARSTAPGPQ